MEKYLEMGDTKDLGHSSDPFIYGDHFLRPDALKRDKGNKIKKIKSKESLPEAYL